MYEKPLKVTINREIIDNVDFTLVCQVREGVIQTS